MNSIQRSILQTAANPAHEYVTVSLAHEGTMKALTGLVYRGYLTYLNSNGQTANYKITAKGLRALLFE